MISIDSYGWIERFTAGPKAQKYDKIIDQVHPSEIITSVVVLFEVYKKSKKLVGELSALENVAVLDQTNVVPIDGALSLEAADYSLEYGLHFSDALVYATSRHFEAVLHTSDEHLRNLPYVNFV